MLEGSNFRKPTNLFVHGYVTVNGAKMSKSRGTFIKAGTYLQHLDADCLRYYYAAKLSSRIDDIDLNLEDFVQRVNADIVNKVVNGVAQRRLYQQTLRRQAGRQPADPALYQTFVDAAQSIAEATPAASSAARSAKSWHWPIWPTVTWMSRHLGWWRRKKAATPICRPSARWASTCSAC